MLALANSQQPIANSHTYKKDEQASAVAQATRVRLPQAAEHALAKPRLPANAQGQISQVLPEPGATDEPNAEHTERQAEPETVLQYIQ